MQCIIVNMVIILMMMINDRFFVVRDNGCYYFAG